MLTFLKNVDTFQRCNMTTNAFHIHFSHAQIDCLEFLNLTYSFMGIPMLIFYMLTADTDMILCYVYKVKKVKSILNRIK